MYVASWMIATAGEMAGDFSGGGPNVTATVDEMATFFAQFRRYVAEELPVLAVASSNTHSSNVFKKSTSSTTSAVGSLLSVMFAINSGSVMEYATRPSGGWHRVLQELDVLAAFGFARLPHSATVNHAITYPAHFS